MATTSRYGKEQRPEWDYQFREWPGGERATLEMMEACRNTMEEVRDELRKMNSILNCKNFISIPATLRGIRRDLKEKHK
jgi:hypothetical protein